MIGLDTSAIIDIFKGSESIKKTLLSINEPLIVTEISYLELMFGLNLENPQHKIEEKYYDEFFQSFLTLDLNTQSCKKASEIFWDLKKKGKDIEQFDCIIAGIFLSNGVNKIISRNIKHFSNITGFGVIPY